MDEYAIIGIFVVVLIPILIALVSLVYTGLKGTAEGSAKMTEAITRLTDKIDMLFKENERQDDRLNEHGRRIDKLEHDVTEQGVKLENLKKCHEKRHID